jgi:hypothetical protein
MDLDASGPTVSFFRLSVFESASAESRPPLCHDLARVLSDRFRTSTNPWADTAYRLIEELRGLGHDLWSHDEGGDFQLWGEDYAESARAGGLRLLFHPPTEVEVLWHGGHPDRVSARAGECSRGDHE